MSTPNATPVIERDPDARSLPADTSAPAQPDLIPAPAADKPVQPKHPQRLVALALRLGFSQSEIDGAATEQLDRDVQRELQLAQLEAARRPAAPPEAPAVQVEEGLDFGVDEEGKPIADRIYPKMREFFLAQKKELAALRKEAAAAKESEQRRNEQWVQREISAVLSKHPDLFGPAGENLAEDDPRYIRFLAFQTSFSNLKQRSSPGADAERVVKTLFHGLQAPAAPAPANSTAPVAVAKTLTAADVAARERTIAEAATLERRRRQAAEQPRANGQFTVQEYVDGALPAPTQSSTRELETGTAAAIEAVSEIQRSRGHYVPRYAGESDLDGIPG
jgi:hypothetical protein